MFTEIFYKRDEQRKTVNADANIMYVLHRRSEEKTCSPGDDRPPE